MVSLTMVGKLEPDDLVIMVVFSPKYYSVIFIIIVNIVSISFEDFFA